MTLNARFTLAVAVALLLTAVAGLVSARDVETPSYVVRARGPAELPATGVGPRMDVVFLIDTTGSMGDEIEVVKAKMRDMVAQIAGGEPTPIVRFGLVLYRDRGDEYVTQLHDLTDDIDAVVEVIRGIGADGGGDYPESLIEALHVAVNDVSWDLDESVDKTIFLIADAPPHMDYEDDYDLKQETQRALERCIIIHAIGCSGLDDADADLFRQIAQGAEGTFNYLTYKREVASEDGTTTIVLEEGGRAYAMDAAAEPDDEAWRKGGAVLREAGAAAEVAPAAAAPMGGPRADGGPGMMAGDAENNLDTILVGQLQRQAEMRGVVYSNTGELSVIARYQGYSSGITEARTLVVRDRAAWEALWNEHTARVEPRPECPDIDFEARMVIAVFAGERPTGGYAVKIDQVKASDDEGAEVTYRLDEPPPGAMVTMALTQPYSMVVVERRPGDIRFVESEKADDR